MVSGEHFKDVHLYFDPQRSGETVDVRILLLIRRATLPGENAMGKRFEEVEHTADIALHIWGKDLADLFANAAYGMASQLTNVEEISPTDEERIALEAEDVEILLVDWLSELLYRGERKNHVHIEFEMEKVTERKLEAVARGGTVDTYYANIKAVTFNELEIVRTEKGYETTIVFDV